MPDGVACDLPLARLQAPVGEGLEAEPGAVVGRGLLGVAHPPLDVVELEELARVRLGALWNICLVIVCVCVRVASK